MSRRLVSCTLVALATIVVTAPNAHGAAPSELRLSKYAIPTENVAKLRSLWLRQLKARYGSGWAPMRFELGDRELKLMGLPSKKVLLSQRYKRPTFVSTSGTAAPVPLTVATFAGTGYFGIRPGMLILLISGNRIGWCSGAHVYGSPGSYDISTAGHCGKPGDRATAVAAFGNRAGATGVVLLDFGTFAASRDGGLGNDWALIDIAAPYQSLTTPTMAFWGGPRGVFTKTGAVAGYSISGKGRPSVTVNPDPFLAQQIVHYGHGIAVGTGGTPRSGTAIAWGSSHFMFFGAISPGDSGSGSNTLLGDTAGANMEAAGINTHLWIDLLMRQGLGIMGGTRTTVVGTPANGQLVGYPAPVPILP